MKKENLQAIYENASTEALNIRRKYKEVKADIEDLEEELANLREELTDLRTEGTAYEGIVYHAIQAGAEDNRGWMQNREDEDEDDSWDENEDEEEDDSWDEDDEDEEEEEWYDPCDYCDHDCERCVLNN